MCTTNRNCRGAAAAAIALSMTTPSCGFLLDLPSDVEIRRASDAGFDAVSETTTDGRESGGQEIDAPAHDASNDVSQDQPADQSQEALADQQSDLSAEVSLDGPMDHVDVSNDTASLDAPDESMPDSTTADVQDAGCSLDLAMDPRNCGRCGHDCLGGKCAAGVCLPFALGAERDPVNHLALWNGGVFATTSGAQNEVIRYDRFGSEREVLVNGSSGAGVPSGIVVDQHGLFFVNRSDGNVMACSDPACSSAPRTLVTGLYRPTDLAAWQEWLYVLEALGGRILRVAKDSTGAYDVLSTADTSAYYVEGPHLVVNDTHVYWSEPFASGTDHVWRIARDGTGSKEAFSSALDRPSEVVLHPNGVLVGTYGGDLNLLSYSGGTPNLLKSNGLELRDIAHDETFIYWLEGGDAPDYTNGRLMRCSLPDCSNALVLREPITDPVSIVVDDEGIFVGSFTGYVWGLAKP